MLTLVIGGAASGKSEYAESLILRLPLKKRIYIATMQPFDDECRARIGRHRKLRAEKNFETVEQYTELSGVSLPDNCAVLLECMSNLCANEMFGEGGGENVKARIISGVSAVKERCGEMVIVSNEVFSSGKGYSRETLEYMRLLADINRSVAEMADGVCEVVCGVPIWHKGGAL